MFGMSRTSSSGGMAVPRPSMVSVYGTERYAQMLYCTMVWFDFTRIL